MTYRFGPLVALCGAAVLALSGCDDEPESEGATASAGTSSTGMVGGSSSSSSVGSTDGTSTGTELSTSSSGDESSSSGSETSDISESDSDTEGPGDPFDCESGGGVLITEFQAELPVFQVGSDAVTTTPLGPICMFPTDTSWVLRLQFGPMDGLDWASTLRVQVAGSGTYDLGSDFGEPGSGVAGPNALSYSLQEGPGTSSFDTSNQAADGTLQVDNWPVAPGDDISVRGDGNIAGADGWRFQFSINAVLP